MSRTRIPAENDGHLAGWLFRIARNLALDFHRSRLRHLPLLALVGDGGRAASQDVSAAVNEALASLAALDRDVFLMREVAGLGYEEIAAACELTADAVRSRIHWVRALDKGTAGLTPMGEDVEVTLRPGESRPIDSVPVVQTGAKTVDGRPCGLKAVSLRVVADFPDFDRRLIGVDAWLVERLPNGKEESQLQSLRGLPNRPINFYFDGVADSGKRFDIFGKLIADPRQGTMEMAVEAVRAETAAGESGYYAARWFRSTLQLKPDETVEVALPADQKNGPLAHRVFAIRLRAKQLR